MDISIIGYGDSGKALHRIFDEAVVYDVNATNYSHTKDVAFQAKTSFICISSSPLVGGVFDISCIEDIIKELKSEIIVINSLLVPGTTSRLAQRCNKRLVFLSEHQNLKVFGGSRENTSKIQKLFTQHSKQFQSILTSFQTAELCKYAQHIGYAAQVTFANEFIELVRISGANYQHLSKIFDLLFSQTLNYNSFIERRGVQDELVQNVLLSAINIAAENNTVSFFLDGISRANNFNLRKNDIYQKKQSDKILFYQIEQPYGYFSNFSNHPVYLKNKIWMTAEHYYQAQKYAGTPYEETIRLASSPVKANQLGQKMSASRQKNWPNIKNDVMRNVIQAKFTQHPDLKHNLICTGSKELVEHTPNDKYWGDGGDGSGENMLGKILMEVREKLQKEESHEGK